jgi:hypothetical protein
MEGETVSLGGTGQYGNAHQKFYRNWKTAVNGKASRRPAGVPQKSRRFGAIVVTKLDRLTRSLRDLVYLTDLADKHQVAWVPETKRRPAQHRCLQVARFGRRCSIGYDSPRFYPRNHKGVS